MPAKSFRLMTVPALCAAVLALQGCDVVGPISSNAVLSDQRIADMTANYFSSTEAHVQVFGFDRQRESTDSASKQEKVHAGSVALPWICSLSLLLAWKVTTRRAWMGIASPVRGLRPGRGALVRI